MNILIRWLDAYLAASLDVGVDAGSGGHTVAVEASLRNCVVDGVVNTRPAGNLAEVLALLLLGLLKLL